MRRLTWSIFTAEAAANRKQTNVSQSRRLKEHRLYGGDASRKTPKLGIMKSLARDAIRTMAGPRSVSRWIETTCSVRYARTCLVQDGTCAPARSPVLLLMTPAWNVENSTYSREWSAGGRAVVWLWASPAPARVSRISLGYSAKPKRWKTANLPPFVAVGYSRSSNTRITRTFALARLAFVVTHASMDANSPLTPEHHVNCDFIETSAVPSHPSSTGVPDLNMGHLELLYNYTTSTYATLSESPVVRDFYRITVVQVGLECDYVMRSLLAVSSLQLAYYRPHMREHYRSTAVHHHEIASRIAGNIIQDLNATRVGNLFLFSALTVFYAFGCPRRVDQLHLVDESDIPSWFFLHQGTRALSELAGTQFDEPLAPLFRHGIDRWEAREVEQQTASPVNQHLDRLQTSIERSEPDAGLRNTYINAISELRKSFQSMECGRGQAYEVTDIFVWVFQVGDDFVPLLRAPTQSAMAILAFFCVLLRGLKSQWWLNGWADYLMAKSYALLDSEHRLWIQWPMEEIGYIP
ncbi:hypothetical protein CIB48_g5041 [Xylaria polymorpha]|nr:hypothetical protein CIB48_g5041 [Xylaria polymorpha]